MPRSRATARSDSPAAPSAARCALAVARICGADLGARAVAGARTGRGSSSRRHADSLADRRSETRALLLTLSRSESTVIQNESSALQSRMEPP